jgi:GNAT superfamily N-acetyltransferase
LFFRPLTPADVPSILRVQGEAYRAELCEPAESFLNKMSLFPEGSVGCFDGDELRGYLVAVAWRDDGVVPLGEPIQGIPADADTLYIHDVAVSAAAQGLGVGRRLAERALEIARTKGARRLALVAVQSAGAFVRLPACGVDPLWPGRASDENGAGAFQIRGSPRRGPQRSAAPIEASCADARAAPISSY